ncbi:MAG: hypothetical protein CL917_12805 [Deltaproteobacteria bacterium]|nr:hypothetical protein [Deltaproteobacteria bacterium]
MSQPIIHWPDASSEQVRAARGRLEVAAALLSQRPRREIVGILGQALDQIRDPNSAWGTELAEATVQASKFSAQNVSAGLDLGLKEWRSSALSSLVAREIDHVEAESSSLLSPYAVTSVVLAGTIPMPNLLQSMLPLALGSTALIKPSSQDPLTPLLLSRCISEIDSELGRCLEVVSFASTDQESLNSFLSSECVVASGSDETIQAIEQNLSPSQRFVGYGHKLSVALINASCLDDSKTVETVSRALAVDISLWDQLGCLSPACVYVLGEHAAEARLNLLEGLADALAERTRACPPGDVSDQVRAHKKQARDEAEMRSGAGQDVQMRCSENTDWTVIAEPDSNWRPTPLHRFVRLYPVRDWETLQAALLPFRPHLSSVGLAGFQRSDTEKLDLKRRLGRLGFSRICPVGQLQGPALAWPHDGRPVLSPLARFLHDEEGPSH